MISKPLAFAFLACFHLKSVSAFLWPGHQASCCLQRAKLFAAPAQDLSFRKKTDFDDGILIRPGAESWMFDEDGNLAENQVKFDWKSVEYRDDQLGGCDPDMSLGPIDEKELVNIAPMLEMFTNTLEVLEASNGVYRFKYWGLVKNQSGMECWGRQMILENHPEPDSVKTVSFLTKRKRDTNLGDKM